MTAQYPTLLANDDYTSVVNARHRPRLEARVADARAMGAQVTVVNPAGEDFARQNGYTIPINVLKKQVIII